MGKPAMNERMIRADGIELATEVFGDPSHPPVLLIMGAMASMLWWPDEFCERLANRGRFIIRYDNRDAGHSTIYEHGDGPRRSKTWPTMLSAFWTGADSVQTCRRSTMPSIVSDQCTTTPLMRISRPLLHESVASATKLVRNR